MSILGCIAVSFLAFQTPTPAQLTLTITDATGGRVADAAVVLSNATSTRTFMTSSEGTLELRDLPTGEWMLMVMKDGFIPLERPVVIQATPTTIALTLDVAGVQESLVVETTVSADPLRLNSVAAGGTLLEIPIRELPASLTIVTQELMQERGATTAMQAVELASGITTYVDSGALPGINIRGFGAGGGSVHVMRDGIRQNTAPQSGRPLDTFLLERIEVLKGPASLLNSEGAVGAAINYITKMPKRQFGIESLLSYGSFGSTRTGLDITGPISNTLSGRIAGVFTDNGSWVPRANDKLRSMAGSLQYTATEYLDLKASGVYSDDAVSAYYGTPFINGVIDPRTRFINYNMRDNLNKAHNNFGKFDAEFRLPAGWRLHNGLFAATQRVDWRNFEGYSYNAALNKVAVSSYFLTKREDLLVGNQLDARKTIRFGGRTIDFVGGLFIQRNDMMRWATPPGGPTINVDPFNPEPIFDPGLPYALNRNVVVNTRSLFAEFLFAMTTKLKLVGGLRWEEIGVDRLEYTTNTAAAGKYHPTTGRAGLVYLITPDVSIYASHSNAVEPTTPLVSIAGAQMSFSLQPSRQWEVGTKTTVLDGRLDTTVAYFRIGKRNILTSTVVDGIRLNQQIGKQVSEGLEFAFRSRPFGSFFLSGDLAVTNAEYADFNENLGTGIVSRSGNDVPHVAAVVWNLTPAQRIGPVTVSASVRTVGARWGEAANTRRLSPFTTMDANISIRLPRNTRLTLTGRNLTDEFYVPRSSNTSGRPGAPRNYEVQLIKNF